MDAQLKKGLLEYCILAIFKKSDTYGYQIIKDMSDLISISESTLYPILRRLEEKEHISSYSKEYNGRIRKYFHLTASGQECLDTFLTEKHQLLKILSFIEGREDMP